MFIVTHNGHQSMSQLIIFQGRMQDDKELLKLEPSGQIVGHRARPLDFSLLFSFVDSPNTYCIIIYSLPPLRKCIFLIK